jgi:hypothetical protein
MAEPLPAFLAPVLVYLSSILPPQIYALIVSGLSASFRLFSSLIVLVRFLLTAEWNAQTLLPPLLSFFFAYLALISVYRATTWTFRVGVWVIKWGVLVGGAIALASWMLGDGKGATGFDLGALLLDLLSNASGQDGYRNEDAGRRTRRTKPRPKPWDSFERHREWQYQTDRGRADGGRGFRNADVQRVIDGIYTSFKDGLWRVAGASEGDDRPESTTPNLERKRSSRNERTSKVR